MDPLKNNVIDSAIITNVAKVKGKLYVNDLLAGIAGMESLEQHILDLIDAFSFSSLTILTDLEKIFHLIQIWGGNEGRYIYVKKKKFDWKSIHSAYLELVDKCTKITNTDDSTLEDLGSYLIAFHKSKKILYLGPSFLSKHVHFWTYIKLRDEALPIYDSIMANNYMREKKPKLDDILKYWTLMVNDEKRVIYKYNDTTKSLEVSRVLSLREYERKLFNFYTI